MTEPTDEELNVALCEWLGWRMIHEHAWLGEPERNPVMRYYGYSPNSADYQPIPNHIHGIEALGHVHEAEKRLADEQAYLYLCELEAIAWKEDIESRPRSLCRLPVVCSNAKQRVIALLRVVRPEVFK